MRGVWSLGEGPDCDKSFRDFFPDVANLVPVVALGRGGPLRRAFAVQFSDLTPGDQNGSQASLGQTLAFALPWILLAVLAVWALRH